MYTTGEFLFYKVNPNLWDNRYHHSYIEQFRTYSFTQYTLVSIVTKLFIVHINLPITQLLTITFWENNVNKAECSPMVPPSLVT